MSLLQSIFSALGFLYPVLGIIFWLHSLNPHCRLWCLLRLHWYILNMANKTDLSGVWYDLIVSQKWYKRAITMRFKGW
jgi:hypothetical protein